MSSEQKDKSKNDLLTHCTVESENLSYMYHILSKQKQTLKQHSLKSVNIHLALNLCIQNNFQYQYL